MDASIRTTIEELARGDQRRVALGHVADAFAEAFHAGVEAELVAEAAIAAALRELVAIFGEDSVSAFAALLAGAVASGEFSGASKH
ncbi:MAG: hypothetical protein KGI57_10255 [Hyphomicrobiales bacterium]|nr:hypothetical protein [Hyphomicrobiales bacterium]MDE2018076.1 hypothetical protein [Hyphomicrobiales bacterium]